MPIASIVWISSVLAREPCNAIKAESVLGLIAISLNRFGVQPRRLVAASSNAWDSGGASAIVGMAMRGI